MESDRSFRVARGLRRAATPQEARLWEWLRSRRLAGLRFRRQHPLGGYVLDFYCAERRLAVELDGAVHLAAEQAEYDRFRDAALQDRGITVLRITNDDIDADIGEVLQRIREMASVVQPGHGWSRS